MKLVIIFILGMNAGLGIAYILNYYFIRMKMMTVKMNYSFENYMKDIELFFGRWFE